MLGHALLGLFPGDAGIKDQANIAGFDKKRIAIASGLQRDNLHGLRILNALPGRGNCSLAFANGQGFPSIKVAGLTAHPHLPTSRCRGSIPNHRASVRSRFLYRQERRSALAIG